MHPIQLEGSSSRGGAALILCSGFILLLLVFNLAFAEQLLWYHAALFILALLGVFAGWAKLSEPRFFLQCDEQGIHYRHRRGSWLLPWNSVLYCAVPQCAEQSLSFIAFKVQHYDPFLQQLPLRLAVRIMTEQRAIYLEAVRQSCVNGGCATELLAEHEHFNTKQASYNGIKAAFAHRMQRLATTLGFELYVPITLAKDEAEQVCRKINQLRLQHINKGTT